MPLTLIAIPDSGEHILDVVGDLPSVRREVAEDLPAAVSRAREVVAPGGSVLLSPAAPSYGRHDNYEVREGLAAAVEASGPASA